MTGFICGIAGMDIMLLIMTVKMILGDYNGRPFSYL